MINVLTDTFTDPDNTALDTHTPESGGGYQLWGGGLDGSMAPQISGGRVRLTPGSGTIYSFRLYNKAHTAAGESITGVIDAIDTSYAASVALILRGQPNGSGYMVKIDPTAAAIYRCVGGTLQQLGTQINLTATSGTHSFEWSVSGTGNTVTLTLKQNGTVLRTVDDPAANRIAAVGYPGLGVYNQGMFQLTRVDAVNVDPPLQNGITINTPMADAHIQRQGAGGTVTVTGAYTGTPTAIEARVVQAGTNNVVPGFDWAIKVAAPATGSYTLSLQGVPPALTWYEVQVRFANDQATTAVSNRFCVSDLILISGQSNAAMFNTLGGGGEAPNPFSRRFGISPGGWSALTGAGEIRLANLLSAALNVPIGILYVGVGGTSIVGWKPGGVQYNAALGYINAAGGQVSDNVFIQGEYDWTAMDGATYMTHLAAGMQGFRTDLGQPNLKHHIVGLAATSYTPRDTYDEVKRAQYDYAAATANTYWVDRTDAQLDASGLHHTAAGFQAIADRAARSILASRGLVASARGPRISQITKVDPTTYDVSITHGMGSDITPAVGSSTGWSCRDLGAAGAAIAVVAAVRHSDKSIRLTLASAPVGSPEIGYLRGGNLADLATVVRDNGQLALPLEYAYGAVADTTAPTMVGDVIISNISETGARGSWSAATDNVSVAGYETALALVGPWTNRGASLQVDLVGLSKGTHYTLYARAYDQAGNVSTPISGQFRTAEPASVPRIVTDPFTDFSNPPKLLPGEALHGLHVVDPTTRTTVLNLGSLTTDDAARLTIESAALVGQRRYVLFAFSADGTLHGASSGVAQA